MDGDKVHTVFGMLFQGIEEALAGQILLHCGIIEGDAAHRNRRRLQDPASHQIQVSSGGEVHDRIRASSDGSQGLFHLLLGRVDALGGPHIDIHLDREHLSYPGCHDLWPLPADVSRDHRPSRRHQSGQLLRLQLLPTGYPLYLRGQMSPPGLFYQRH